MKLMIRNCPTQGLNLWMIIQNFYDGLNFASRNLLYSATGGTSMEITLGEATKLLDNIMANYSQWHTERSTSKKVHAIEEINVLSGKMDELISCLLIRVFLLILMICPCLLWLRIIMNLWMWILLVGTILVTTRIEVILTLGYFLVIPLIIMVIPTTILVVKEFQCFDWRKIA